MRQCGCLSDASRQWVTLGFLTRFPDHHTLRIPSATCCFVHCNWKVEFTYWSPSLVRKSVRFQPKALIAPTTLSSYRSIRPLLIHPIVNTHTFRSSNLASEGRIRYRNQWSDMRCFRQWQRVDARRLCAYSSLLLSLPEQDPNAKIHLPFWHYNPHLIYNMSVFSLEVARGNPVTTHTVENLCAKLGVSIEEQEKEDYRRLLAIFHDASAQLMAMDGK